MEIVTDVILGKRAYGGGVETVTKAGQEIFAEFFIWMVGELGGQTRNIHGSRWVIVRCFIHRFGYWAYDASMGSAAETADMEVATSLSDAFPVIERKAWLPVVRRVWSWWFVVWVCDGCWSRDIAGGLRGGGFWVRSGRGIDPWAIRGGVGN